MVTSPPGLALIKSSEGLRLTAYQDSAGVWTIGYGSTRDVHAGMVITEAQADQLLAMDVAWAEKQVSDLVKVPLTQGQFDALVSLTFNVGSLLGTTLMAKLNKGDYAGAAAEFPRWVHAGNQVLTGLVARRAAERAMFEGEQSQRSLHLYCPAEDSTAAMAIGMQDLPLCNWVAFRLSLAYREDLAAGKVYLGHGPGFVQPATPATGDILLSVPYFSQRDSQVPGQAERSCFSSSCAMLLEALKPGTLPGANGDDTYLAWLERSAGDTIDAAAQVASLAHFGVKATFRSDCTWPDVDAQLARGIPVPIGILHHGPVTAPFGGGHWICVIGRNADGYWVNDPWGELDLVAGTYDSSPGKGPKLLYSRANLGPRWIPGSGYAILAVKP